MIDLRSDTVTRPGAAMRKAMADAEVGDDVFGEDPTINRLQSELAERAGMEAGLFLPSGTQSNLVALLTHCGRGDEYIVGQHAHTYMFEGGGAAVLGGIQPQPLDFEEDGSLAPAKVAAAIKPRDDHFARTRLVCLENTVGGKALPQRYLQDMASFVRERDLAYHLDGARVFNAVVEQQVSLSDITAAFDSVSICLSKGLGAPAGSVLCGSREFIDAAHRWRKVTGGGMRQAGILAAAGLYALEHHVTRLEEDHAKAHLFAKLVGEERGLIITGPFTNMLFIDAPDLDVKGLVEFMARHDVLLYPMQPVRLVFHLDVSEQAVRQAAKLMLTYFRGNGEND
ncbi:MAG: low-specificity L-threonine aldolase [Gammaproteobacteria bacterium]